MSGTRSRRRGDAVGSTTAASQAARRDLDEALDAVTEAGRLTPCQRYPDPFTRDGRLAPGLRAVAVDLCGSCRSSTPATPTPRRRGSRGTCGADGTEAATRSVVTGDFSPLIHR